MKMKRRSFIKFLSCIPVLCVGGEPIGEFVSIEEIPNGIKATGKINFDHDLVKVMLMNNPFNP